MFRFLLCPGPQTKFLPYGPSAHTVCEFCSQFAAFAVLLMHLASSPPGAGWALAPSFSSVTSSLQ